MTAKDRPLALCALTALLTLAALATLALSGTSVSRAEGPALVIDAGIVGNTQTTVGELNDCVSVPRGQQFQIDVVIQDVTNLLAWELALDYDPRIAIVVAHDVKMFQAANQGSSVIDISARVPDDSGFHTLSAFDSSDPPAIDSGSGVLARVTMEAVGDGQSLLRFANRDLNGDGIQDSGTLLRDVDANVIGDENNDQFFDGTMQGAMVVVGGDCPAGSNAVVVPATPSGGSGSQWPYVVAAAAGMFVVVVVGGVILVSRRQRTMES